MLIISYPEVIILLSHDFIVLQYHTRRHNIIILCITILDTIIIHNNCRTTCPMEVHRDSPSLSALYHFELSSLEAGALRHFELCPDPRAPSVADHLRRRSSPDPTRRHGSLRHQANKYTNILIYYYVRFWYQITRIKGSLNDTYSYIITNKNTSPRTKI